MVGARVRLAREACRLTQERLAQAAGITQAAVSAIESGRTAQPTADVVACIAAATQFPIPFFLRGPLPDLPEGNYRRLARGTSKVDKQIRAQVLHVVEIVQSAEAVLKLPPIVVDPVRDVRSLDSLEELALEVRATLGLSPADPIRNLTRAIERAGVVVVRLPGEMKHHDSFSTWPDFQLGGRPIIALTAGHPGDRDRFNTAHEFSHLVLHTARPRVELKAAEAEAHRLAGAILLPRTAAKARMADRPVTLRVLMEVKAEYGISMAATARRAYDLGLIGALQFRSINKQLSARQWKKNEPVEVSSEKTIMIARIIERLGGEGSILQRANRIPMATFTLRAIEAA